VTADAGEEPTEYRQYRFALAPGATDILLVRHGESMPARPDAPAPLIDGHSDPALDPVGEEQARLLAERLAGDDSIAAIYVTTLRRTQQTAAPTAAKLGLTPTVVADLREVQLGDWEGYTFRKNTAERHEIAVKMFSEQRWDVIPNAESTEHLSERVRRGINAIAAAHPDQRVLVVVHGGVIGTILSIATGGRPFAFISADNGSISQLIVSGDDWAVRRYNDAAHLESLRHPADG
jgi:2,3-bisphosphoglycerate-dependent phosphoglycerate mutase